MNYAFRAYDKKKKEWIHKGPFHIMGEFVVLGALIDRPFIEWEDVDIMADVNLCYNDGRPAFVGDIFKDDRNNLYRIFEVEGGYAINVSAFPKTFYDDYPFPLCSLSDEQTVSWFKCCAVYVGNIWDNPEMLINVNK